ncbi:MAG: hydrolase [Paludibacter sp.]|nr:MAG: hydrolase [Paludibacter sp.]
MNIQKNRVGIILLRLLLLVSLVIIIVQFFPNDKKFKYFYEIGKPWNYELLTASFDFPIYKTKIQLEKDKENLLKNYSPYFQKDETCYSIQYNRWLEEWNKKNEEKPTHLSYVQSKMRKIYKKGIISYSDYERVKQKGKNAISLVKPNREVMLVAVDELYTPKTAYEELLFNQSFSIFPEEITDYNLNLFLVPNVRYDSIMSNKVKAEKIKNLSKTLGMVQAGEKIINKGEIVTAQNATILNSLKIELQNRTSTFRETSFVLLGEIILITTLLLLFFSYFFLFRREIYDSFKMLLFFSLLMVMMIGLVAIVLHFTKISLAIIPFAFLPIIIRVFFDSRTALFSHIIVILLISFLVKNPFAFIVIQTIAGIVAVSGLKDMTARGQLAQTAFYVFWAYAISYFGFSLISEGDIQLIDYMEIAYYFLSSVLLLFTYILIYVFEKLFGLVSSVTLVELTNINSDFMLKFAEVAPGSFQHSLQVSNLAAEAAKKINANSLLVRTGALYHDIGKMKHPEYFIENQGGGENPLLKMSYEDASKAIIAHVTDGIEMARKQRLPEQIIVFISTHHGKSVTRYFYNSFINENPGVTPDIDKFSYLGPLPYSKEMAILMMADAVEARSRTLGEYTEESIKSMVEDMINIQISEGQFKDAPISFKDVEAVKEVLTEKVLNIYHNRIKYPELKENDDK